MKIKLSVASLMLGGLMFAGCAQSTEEPAVPAAPPVENGSGSEETDGEEAGGAEESGGSEEAPE